MMNETIDNNATEGENMNETPDKGADRSNAIEGTLNIDDIIRKILINEILMKTNMNRMDQIFIIKKAVSIRKVIIMGSDNTVMTELVSYNNTVVYTTALDSNFYKRIEGLGETQGELPELGLYLIDYEVIQPVLVFTELSSDLIIGECLYECEIAVEGISAGKIGIIYLLKHYKTLYLPMLSNTLKGDQAPTESMTILLARFSKVINLIRKNLYKLFYKYAKTN